MTLSKEELDAFCGGPPTLRKACPYPGCDKVVEYYNIGHIRQAMREHINWVHRSDDPVDNEREKPNKPNAFVPALNHRRH